MDFSKGITLANFQIGQVDYVRDICLVNQSIFNFTLAVTPFINLSTTKDHSTLEDGQVPHAFDEQDVPRLVSWQLNKLLLQQLNK